VSVIGGIGIVFIRLETQVKHFFTSESLLCQEPKNTRARPSGASQICQENILSGRYKKTRSVSRIVNITSGWLAGKQIKPPTSNRRIYIVPNPPAYVKYFLHASWFTVGATRASAHRPSCLSACEPVSHLPIAYPT
jgi:hypothetical protein